MDYKETINELNATYRFVFVKLINLLLHAHAVMHALSKYLEYVNSSNLNTACNNNSMHACRYCVYLSWLKTKFQIIPYLTIKKCNNTFMMKLL